MLDVMSVTKSYPGKMALSNVSFELKKGEFAFLMGSSGSGKSTLLKLIYAVEQPTSGRIFLENKDVSKLSPYRTALLRRRIGIVFQDFKLISTKTVWENVAFAMEVQGAASRNIKHKVAEVLGFVGLNLRSRDFPNMLSGGEQQRIAIARALVNDPPLLLADEPTGNLDYENSLSVLDLLLKINTRGTSILIATHDKNMVESTKKRIIKLDHGQKVSDANVLS